MSRLPTGAAWAELDRHLEQCLALPDHQREPWLIQLADTQPALAAQLRGLLAHHAASRQIDAIAQSPLYIEAMLELGRPGDDEIGGWRLLERLGTGAMSDVFSAERQVHGTRQNAALKLMAAGPLPAQLRERFAAETAILARLDEPRIARLIDAGVLADGRAWLATERVDGLPIDRHCDDRHLSIGARVALLIEVALAVASAHRQLVVHRDLKPANILVTRQGQVKVLDFGIGRWLDSDISDAIASAGVRPAHTPGYASPEQLRGQDHGTASDLYQLGLLLFGLLTGRHPFADVRDDPTAYAQAIQHQAPTASRCVDTGHADDVEQARRRGLRPSALRRLLRGDLDAIVACALDPDPTRRYPGALALADDLQRWLQAQPVQARRGGRLYRSRRWLRRHRLGAGLAAVAAAACLALTVAWLVQMMHTAEQARSRNAVLTLLEQVLYADRLGTQPQPPDTVPALLNRLDERAGQTLAQSPAALAQTLFLVGRAYLGRGDYRLAADALLRVRELLAALPAEADLHHALSEPLLRALHYAGDYAEAGAWAQAALQHLPALPEADQVAVRLAHADLLHSLGDYAAAQQQAIQAHRLAEQRFGAGHPRSARAEQTLGMVLRDRGQLEAATTLLRQAAEHERQTLGARHVNLAATLDHLTYAYLLRGDLDAARRSAAEVNAIRAYLYQPGSLSRAWGTQRLAQIHLLDGDADAARRGLTDLLAIYERSLHHDSHLIALARADLGWALLAAGQVAAARTQFALADQTMAIFAGGEHPRRSEILLGRALLAQVDGDAVQAGQLATAAEALRRRGSQADHPTRIAACRVLADLAADPTTHAACPPGQADALPLRQLELARRALGPAVLNRSFPPRSG